MDCLFQKQTNYMWQSNLFISLISPMRLPNSSLSMAGISDSFSSNNRDSKEMRYLRCSSNKGGIS